MPLTYLIDARRRIGTVATGSVTPAEIVAHLDQEQADNVLGLPEYVDATRAIAAFTPDEVRSILNHIRVMRRDNPLGPTAILVADDLSYGMLRMLQILADDVCEVHPFRDCVEAEAWLGPERGENDARERGHWPPDSGAVG